MRGRLGRATGRLALVAAAVAAIGFGAPSPALAAESATVKTAEEFKAAVESKASTITVAGNFALNDEVALSADADITLGGSGTITAGDTGGIKVPSGAKLTIDSDSLTLDGGGSGVTHTVPFIWSQGELALRAGTIQNFTGGNPSVQDVYLGLTGVNAVYIDASTSGSESTFTMDGGTIQKNATTDMSYGGAGVKLLGKDAYMTMNGGTITQNSAQRTDTSDGVMGGGILMFNGGTFTMNAGIISDNVAGSMEFKSEGMGGGVAGIGMGYSAHMVMNGGTITGNKALSGVGAGHGGGVMMHTNTSFVANGGTITNNETTGMGGGLYVDGIATGGVSANRFYNTVITGNTATNLGGGLWICPTGYGTVSVTKGAAIYGNSAPVNADKSSAGDDFVVHPHTDKGFKVTLADRMLGGGKAMWYQDGGLQANRTNESGEYAGPTANADPNVARYDAANPGDPVVMKDDTGDHALKNVTTEGAQNLANKLGKVLISGNKAKVGGGVATNQMISFGGNEDTGEDVDAALTVSKTWDSSVASADQKEVTVDLKIGGEVIDSAALNKDNGWQATFKNLPNPEGYDGGTPYILDKDGNHLAFEVVEQGDEFSVTYEWRNDITKLGDTPAKLSMIVTNKKLVSATFSLAGAKTISGREFQKGDAFTFAVKAKDGAPMPSGAKDGKVTVKPMSGTTATVDFGTLTFDKAGTYTYEIAEQKGESEGMTYDTAVRTVTVTVARGDDEQSLVATAAYSVDSTVVDSLAWTNAYEKPSEPAKPEQPSEPKPEQPSKPKSEKPAAELPQTGDASFAPVAVAAAAGVAAIAAGTVLAVRRKH